MATATKKSQASKRLARRADSARSTSSMEFLVFEDNGGSYHWRILSGEGVTLGRSGDFASCHDAEQAAQHVREGAASAHFEVGGRIQDEPGAGRGEDAE